VPIGAGAKTSRCPEQQPLNFPGNFIGDFPGSLPEVGVTVDANVECDQTAWSAYAEKQVAAQEQAGVRASRPAEDVGAKACSDFS
jgi:hypothetical protein